METNGEENLNRIARAINEELVEIARQHMLTPSLERGIHGVRHIARTVAMAGAIHHSLPHKVDSGLILCGAAFHDIGRIDEGTDPEHGFRAARQVLVAANQVALALPEMLPVERAAQDVWKGKLLDIVFHHCQVGSGTFIEMQITMDADKLDRFRLGPKALDSGRLALSASHELIGEAQRYVEGDMKKWNV